VGSAFNTALWGGGVPAGTVVTSGRALVYGALRLLGVLRPGQTASDASHDDGLAWLNELVDSWATERLTVKVVARSLIAMTGAASYAAGPHRIEHAGYVDTAGTERPLGILTLEQWGRIGLKSQSGTPASIYPEATFPEATIYPWPVPADGSLAIYQWQPLEALADLDTEYAFPPGYALALRFCLAAQIAPAFIVICKIPQPLLDSIEAKAADYKGKIKSLNVPILDLRCDDALIDRGSRFDIVSGDYV
jgi:hypothetical protein